MKHLTGKFVFFSVVGIWISLQSYLFCAGDQFHRTQNLRVTVCSGVGVYSSGLTYPAGGRECAVRVGYV